tara:strand:+ start:3842 stop:5095 length:1254 start_codon:yes stop_codon:yes gene_type:complete
MFYKLINLTTRGVDRRSDTVQRRIGIEVYEESEWRKNSQYRLSSYNGWRHWAIKTPRPSFKMDFTVETVANGFKSLFTAHLSSTNNRKNILLFDFNDFHISVKNARGSVVLNGQTMTRTIAARHLAALCFQTKDTYTREEVRDKFFKIISIPPDVNYAIINRAPYSFYKEGKYIKCRLNVKQISSKEVALEISEGVWGTLTIKQFLGYLSHYLHGTNRGSWAFTSPERLYERVMGKEGRESDIKVMKSFLIQNRTSDLVNERAEVLLKETLEKHSGKIKHYSVRSNNILFVQGIENDWVIRWSPYNSDKEGRQLVRTQYLETSMMDTAACSLTKEKSYSIARGEDDNWIGVCVDNLQTNSPQVDQAISRVLVCLNDKATKQMVSTMRSIDSAKYRIDFDSFIQKEENVIFSLKRMAK